MAIGSEQHARTIAALAGSGWDAVSPALAAAKLSSMPRHPSFGFVAANANGFPRIHPLAADVLEHGMTFHIKPAAYFEGGMRYCDLVTIASYVAHVLADF